MMDENGQGAKTSGYLEKKGRKKILASYKKYWFVLEGRLLLYYRSKAEYEAISPCKGSINLGPSCTVKPCASSPGVFQIEIRSSTITLRAENREEQNRWMQSIMAAIGSGKNPPKLSHFRYSLDDLPKAQKQAETEASDTKIDNIGEGNEEPVKYIIQRLQKMGAQTYGNPLVNIKKSECCTQSDSNLDENCNSQEKTLYATTDHKVLTRTKASSSAEHIYERLYPIEETKVTSGNSFDNTVTNDSGRGLNESSISMKFANSENNDKIDSNKDTMKKNTKNCDGSRKSMKVKKCSSFLRRVWERKSKKKWEAHECSPAENKVEVETKENDTVEDMMLTELQSVLEMKIPHLKVDPASSTLETCKQNERIVENQAQLAEDSDSNACTSQALSKKQEATDRGHSDNCRSIDEILEELDKENEQHKVKHLIKKFSEQEFSAEVELRASPLLCPHMDDIDPDELARLLIELSKVTNAPLSIPGTTHSLIATQMRDSELSHMLPPKKRRHSEPDYDVPRPHKSVFTMLKKEDTGNKIGSTRFFGPVLGASYMGTVQNRSSGGNSPGRTSMTPDSLEVDIHPQNTCAQDVAQEEENFSYEMEQKPIPNKKNYNMANNYLNIENRDMNDFIIKNQLYDDPKAILMYDFLFDNNDATQNEEVFIDSLEVGNS